jgi:ABC-type transport system involved in Fe-S cluster assembly fused permease/ATPase subunit
VCRPRLSTITDSDQIIVVHGGVVVEHGTHEELLGMNGRYRAMWSKQTRSEKAVAETPAAEAE